MTMKLIAVRITDEQIKRLEKLAKKEDRPVSWLIRRAIDELLRRRYKD